MLQWFFTLKGFMKKETEVGKIYSHLTVLGDSENRPGYFRLSCTCGKVIEVLKYSVRSGNTKSCGCSKAALQRAVTMTHGMTKTPLYMVWAGMRARCYNKNNISYKLYGPRGITVCERWNNFENFLSDMGPRPQGATLERKDNNGNYEPSNCIWATHYAQNINRRDSLRCKYKGVEYTIRALSELPESQGVTYATLHARLMRGWSVEKAMTSPLEKPGTYLRGVPRAAETEEVVHWLYGREIKDLQNPESDSTIDSSPT